MDQLIKAPWLHFLSEFVGTALLISVGLSVVILNFGAGGPVVSLFPNPGIRRVITGFLFGAVGGLIALSPIGKVSGAHINPVVSLAFCLLGKLRPRHAVGYVLAQLCGAGFGGLPLLAWGRMGASIAFGATVPGPGYSAVAATLGELATTSALVIALFLFLGHRRLRVFTPCLFPFLYAVMVYLEAPISGTSTNPARSLGPAFISGDWCDWWVYWVGPVLGSLVGLSVYSLTRLRLRSLEVEVAKLYHFGYDPHRFFRWGQSEGGRGQSQSRRKG
jgi:aquaporin Z